MWGLSREVRRPGSGLLYSESRQHDACCPAYRQGGATHHDHNPGVYRKEGVLSRVAGYAVVCPQEALPRDRFVIARERSEYGRGCRGEGLKALTAHRAQERERTGCTAAVSDPHGSLYLTLQRQGDLSSSGKIFFSISKWNPNTLKGAALYRIRANGWNTNFDMN